MSSNSKDSLTTAILSVQSSLSTLIQANHGDALTFQVRFYDNCDTLSTEFSEYADTGKPWRRTHFPGKILWQLWCSRYRGAFNNVAASLAASLDSSSSIERISRKARLAKMTSVAKVF